MFTFLEENMEEYHYKMQRILKHTAHMQTKNTREKILMNFKLK